MAVVGETELTPWEGRVRVCGGFFSGQRGFGISAAKKKRTTEAVRLFEYAYTSGIYVVPLHTAVS